LTRPSVSLASPAARLWLKGAVTRVKERPGFPSLEDSANLPVARFNHAGNCRKSPGCPRPVRRHRLRSEGVTIPKLGGLLAKKPSSSVQSGQRSVLLRQKKLPLHFGHRPATSAVTGRVKCFTCPQAVHFQPRDRNSPSLGRSANARCASPLMFSRRSRRWSFVWAIDLAPTGAAGGGVCVCDCRKIGSIAVSCSHEHIIAKSVRPVKNAKRNPLPIRMRASNSPGAPVTLNHWKVTVLVPDLNGYLASSDHPPVLSNL
jgi:hypothetical protein